MADFPFTILAEILPVSLATNDLSQLELAGLARDSQPAPLQVLRHCDVARSRLLQVLKDKPILEALLCEYLKPLDELETAYFQLLNERFVDTAIGVQLDGLGAIVGKPRNGRSDDDYRTLIKVRLLVLRSDGKREQLIAILVLLLGLTTGQILITPYYPANLCYEVVPELTEDPFEVAASLGDAKPGGVRLFFKYALSPEADTFAFAPLPGTVEVDSQRGWSNPAQSTGGHLLGIILTT